MPSLYRTSDNAGDSGSVSLAIWVDDGVLKFEHNARPRVGVCMQVGSASARSFSHQDFWTTTVITEIIDETVDTIKFKTKNSIYIWRA